MYEAAKMAEAAAKAKIEINESGFPSHSPISTRRNHQRKKMIINGIEKKKWPRSIIEKMKNNQHGHSRKWRREKRRKQNILRNRNEIERSVAIRKRQLINRLRRSAETQKKMKKKSSAGISKRYIGGGGNHRNNLEKAKKMKMSLAKKIMKCLAHTSIIPSTRKKRNNIRRK